MSAPTVQGSEVLACITGALVLEDGVHVPVEGLTAPYYDPIAYLCHVAANEPAKPPQPQ